MATIGRRAVEHPPQSGFRRRRGFALSVVNTAGHLPTPRRWGTRVSWGGLSMTKDASFKKVVRRHAEETGQRYTEALTDLAGLSARMHHEPVPERLLTHLRDRHGIDPVAATKLSVHKTYVFRIDRKDGSPWVARAFPPARPRPELRATPRSSVSWSGRAIPLSAWPLRKGLRLRWQRGPRDAVHRRRPATRRRGEVRHDG